MFIIHHYHLGDKPIATALEAAAKAADYARSACKGMAIGGDSEAKAVAEQLISALEINESCEIVAYGQRFGIGINPGGQLIGRIQVTRTA